MKDWDTDERPDRWVWLEFTAVAAMVIYIYVSLIYHVAVRLIAFVS